MQLILRTDLAKALPAEIEFNFDELKEELDTRLEAYRGKTVTIDRVSEAKEECATLNRVFKAIDDARKMVKKECLRPYEAFEKKANILLSLISSVRDEQKSQLDAIEADRKAKKFEAVKSAFAELVGDLEGLVSIEQIAQPSWLNKSNSTWRAELESALGNIRAGLSAVDAAYNGESKTRAKAEFLRTFDLAGTMAAMRDYEERAKAIAATNTEPQKPVATQPQNDPILECALVFKGRRSALVQLRAAMESLGIEYRKIAIPEEAK